MPFCFDCQYLSSFQKLFKSDHPLKGYKQIKQSTLGGAVAGCAILGTVALLLAYHHLPRT